jgi:hypothetical protein
VPSRAGADSGANYGVDYGAAFLAGGLTDHELQADEITRYLAGLPEVPASA